MTQYTIEKRPPTYWLVTCLALVLVLGSSLHRFPINVGVANLYIPHILALAIFPTFFYRDRKTSLVRGAVLAFLSVTVIACLPSLLLPSPETRLSFLLQIILNSFTLVLAFALFRQLSRHELKRLILACGVILTAATFVQLVVAPAMNTRGETTLGLPHPILFFSEETWLALFAALLSLAAFGMGSRKMGVVLAIIAFFIGTRSAMIVAGAAFLMSYQGISHRKWLRISIVALPAAFAIWFTADSIFAKSKRVFNDTLDTRAYDIHAVRQANHDVFFPFGGEMLSVFDYSRSRQVPATSNVQAFELIWKFGLAGLLVLFVFILLISWILPKLLVSAPERPNWPIWSGLMIWPAMLQFNNSFGFPWMWVLLALLLAVLASETRRTDFDSSDAFAKSIKT